MIRTRVCHTIRFFLLCLFVGTLAACAAQDVPLPPCPNVSIEKTSATAVAFSDPESIDITDQIYMAELVAVDGECQYNDDQSKIIMSLQPVFQFVKGPATNARSVDFSYYVAIPQFYPKASGKNIFTPTISFPQNVETVRFRDEAIALQIPLNEGETGVDYDVFVGFQLSEKQLEFNRMRTRHNR